ncbi:processive 1,2-diacylglycerol beta-glucosyltransferase [Alkalithermobacter thermoalcaliphilus JW-YL-7 = DSM 7308]|uniref:Monogalactosyldiacylglycerol synthase n=1 Tax=Alkalithermobacter thermoalcaliphilus JW-YL-7 = DSM 7308 TaxID=1121328 RepID=A0A150FT79_CLOPD|nr:Monogalactosyldiacylglycerol synthase [[Clostridium] paradoxum JW-YL-7 = DSM 7308]SHL28272.1 processive 1,2-diacylglycerol beta-glucosyltransferase [[Clostridium] paradoxum JW-YL-7 = DSM 7308]
MKKVLILSASTGGGHNRAAKALQDALSSRNIQSEIIDSLKFVSPTVDKIISKGYEKSAIYTPKAYGKVYKISDWTISKRELNKNIFLRYMMIKLNRLISDKKPDAIIGTHPFPLMAVSKLKKKHKFNIPIMSILTDYTIHSTWIQDEIDFYIVGDEFVKQLLIEEGIHKDKIYPFGIPIEKSFLEIKDIDSVKKEFNIDDKFTVLLMGGSFGAGNVKDAFLDLLNINYDIQIIVVTGRNDSLKEKIKKIIDLGIDKKVVLLSFTDKISHLMSLSDVLISKPGGLTTTEAILKEIPMVIPYYIPGQEEENIDFLLNNGLALKTTPKYNLKVLIQILIENPDRLQNIKNNMRLIKKLHSAENIADLIANELNK